MARVFIIAKFRGADDYETQCNVQRAEQIAYELAQNGMTPICVQSMYRHFNHTLTDEFWLNACKEILQMSDFVYDTEDDSPGCIGERLLCISEDIGKVDITGKRI